MRSICFQTYSKERGFNPDSPYYNKNNYNIIDIGRIPDLYFNSVMYPKLTPAQSMIDLQKEPNEGLKQQIAQEPDLYEQFNRDLGIAGTMIGIADTANMALYNTEDSYGNLYDDIAMRGTAEDRTVGNRLKELIFTGNGLWGQTSADKEINQAVNWRKSQVADFSDVKNNANMENAYYQFMPKLDYITPNKKNDPRQKAASIALNNAGDYAYDKSLKNFYDTVNLNNQRELRTNMYNIFQMGGYLPNDNNITEFNTGGTHQQNPYGGIQQGIASDGKPNYVEEGEVRYNDYVYSARNTPSESLLKKYNLI